MEKTDRSEEHAGRAAWWVYILRCGDGSFYTGATNDVERRLRAHQSGKGAAYTRSHAPVELCYTEMVGGMGDALRREAAIKKLNRRSKGALVASWEAARGDGDADIR